MPVENTARVTANNMQAEPVVARDSDGPMRLANDPSKKAPNGTKPRLRL